MTLEQDISNTRIEDLGVQVKDRLLAANPIFRPDQLTLINGLYSNFFPHRHAYRLWSSSETLNEVMKHYFQHPKVFALISGVAAGGKDALREKIEELAPHYLYKIVTGTSRSPRPGERQARDYYFYDGAQAFLDAANRGEFLETTEQSPGRWYGLPKQSLIDALARPEQVLCSHVEMSAWPKVERFIEETYGNNSKTKPFVLKIFVMPEMTAQQYFSEWLPAHRTDSENRAIRAGWELQHAPSAAHFLVTNVVDQKGASLDLEGKSMINAMGNLFPIGTQFPSYEFPPISPGIANIPDTLAFQNRQTR